MIRSHIEINIYIILIILKYYILLIGVIEDYLMDNKPVKPKFVKKEESKNKDSDKTQVKYVLKQNK